MSQRLDKWLVYARFVKHRALASALIEQGHVRLNRERVVKNSQSVKPDDVLTITLGGHIRVVKVLGQAEKRGSAPQAHLLYLDMSPAQKADATAETVC